MRKALQAGEAWAGDRRKVASKHGFSVLGLKHENLERLMKIMMRSRQGRAEAGVGEGQSGASGWGGGEDEKTAGRAPSARALLCMPVSDPLIF